MDPRLVNGIALAAGAALGCLALIVWIGARPSYSQTEIRAASAQNVPVADFHDYQVMIRRCSERRKSRTEPIVVEGDWSRAQSLLASDRPAARVFGLSVLSHSEGFHQAPVAANEAARYLEDPDEQVRMMAVVLINRLQHPARRALTEARRRDPSPEVANHAQEILSGERSY